ncbi:MAG TPA: hypothetical protein DEH78_20715, partial [Solibacterales bacterium]|nr:hypothetical protein [Bryobacterales bacterium]
MASPADTEAFQNVPPNFHAVFYQRSDTALLDNLAFPLFLRRYAADLYHVPLSAVPLLMPTPYVVTIHDMGSI